MALFARPAEAYNWKTHVRMVEVAAELMQPASNDPNAPPPGVDPTLWAQYVEDIRSGVSRLGTLQSGLPDAKGENTFSCLYRPTDDMSQIPNDRIKDMTYLPIQGGQVIGGGSPTQYGGECSEIQIQCFGDDALRVGRVLGWQGASADNHEEDSTLWDRPTNAAFLGAVTAEATDAFNIGAAALLLPFTCFANLLDGDGCDLGQATDLASDINPIDNVMGLIPGVNSQRDYSYVGLWHFIDVADGDGFYNPNRGMLYTSAGPSGTPGVVDVAIAVGADIIGLSLNAPASAGVSRYGQFDAITRNDAQWQAQTIGHTEFSPISNMAQFGWNQYASTPSTAYPLTWPLHAFGDAAEPQHVAGTTSYGHRPYEDEVDNLLDSQLLPPPPSCSLAFLEDFFTAEQDPAQEARILLDGFNFWNKYHAQFSASTMPVRAMVSDLASQTLGLAQAAEAQQGGSVFNDGLSVEWQTGINVGSSPSAKQSADDGYSGSVAPMQAMLEEGTGAIIAFLAGAGRIATDPGMNASQECPNQGKFDYTVGHCAGNGPPVPNFDDAGGLLFTTPADGDAGCAIACDDAGGCPSSLTCSSGCCVQSGIVQ